MRKTPQIHLSIQKYIIAHLPQGEGFIEFPLPKHYADVAWPKRKIVFEIQCSKITAEAAHQRTKDYIKMGYNIVWILHQLTFNRKTATTTEYLLRKQNCLYTNISSTGHGNIYDQFEIYRFRKRLWRSRPLIVDISNPIIQNKKVSFQGDRYHQSTETIQSYKQKKASLQRSPIKKMSDAYDRSFTKFLIQLVE